MNNPCQKCKKQRATVLVTEIDVETNKPREMHLCESCLAESALPKKPAVGVPAVTFATTILGIPDPTTTKTKSGRRITCPMLALWGDPSGKRPSLVDVWQRWADDVRGQAIRCGHFLAEEAPAETLAALDAFLDRA